MAIFVSFAGISLTLAATTLQQMGLAEMTEQSHSIMRATVTGSRRFLQGDDVYTAYRLNALEVLKAGRNPTEVAVPGGVAGKIRQVVPGAPVLHNGREYVVFLWTAPSGLTQLTGLSQGLFSIRRTHGHAPIAIQASANEQMLDAEGHVVRGEAQSLSLAELQGRISRMLGKDQPLSPSAPRSTGAKK